MIIIKQALLIGLLSDAILQHTFQGKLYVGVEPLSMLSTYIIFLSPAIRL
jgi:hypothetical protein